MLTSFITAIFLLHYRPYVSPLLFYLEIFNEITAMVLLNIIFGFTDLVPEVKIQYMIGRLFVGVILINISVHLFFLVKTTAVDLKLNCKKKQIERQRGINKVKLGNFFRKKVKRDKIETFSEHTLHELQKAGALQKKDELFSNPLNVIREEKEIEEFDIDDSSSNYFYQK